MKVLVTGAGGFIGRHLVESQLAQGCAVRAVDCHVASLTALAAHPRLEIIEGDLTNGRLPKKIVPEIDVVYHLASAHLDVTLSEDHYRQVNVVATRNLLEAACAARVGRFVHCSSNGVLGHIKQPPADETAPCYPTNVYEQTKLEGERTALAFYHDTQFPVVVARPAWVYGPGCPRTARLWRTIGKGRFIMFGNGRTLRHPIFISDAVKGLELCASRGKAGEIYFLAGERPLAINELVQTMAEVQGARPPTLRLPLFMGLAAAYGVQWVCGLLRRRAPITRRTLDFFMKHNAYNIGKARRELGFDPAVSLREGLQQVGAGK